MELSIANVHPRAQPDDDVEWSAEDATRSEMDYLCRIVEAVIKAGATTVNIPDSRRLHHAGGICRFMRTLIERVPNSDKAVFSVHCHNDLGMAGGEFAGRHRRRRAADRVHRQRASANGPAMPRSRKL